MSFHSIDLSSSHLRCTLQIASALTLTAFGLQDCVWAEPSSPMFTIEVDAQQIDAHATDLHIVHVDVQEQQPGQKHATIQLQHQQTGLLIFYHLAVYKGTALIESWLEIENQGSQSQHISRIDSLVLDLPQGSFEISSMTGSWGLEFDLQVIPLTHDIVLESRSGRSSHGHHPWLALSRDASSILSAAVAWSGNWIMRLLHNSRGLTFSGGLHDWEFGIDLASGSRISSPPVIVVLAADTDLNTISSQYAEVGRRYWYPHNPLSDKLPVEWNHWWCYEDKDINEAVFRQNVDKAAELGIEVCTLDAGWFGASDRTTHWYEQRGDWHLLNTQRFPSGLRALSDYVHAHGMAFGLWCEIEAIGKQAVLATMQPELVAIRDGQPLGYVCLGSPAGQEWTLATLERLISDYRCDWIKLDFNLDPGAGCNRSDHGHGHGDGLYAHYQGYYALLSQIRARHPHVVLENCSSGGLRIDLGLARHTHMAFLSDPDWPEHSLQCFYGASLMLAPDALLHWGYCEWCHAEHRYQHFDPTDPQLQAHQLDYYTRISMLRRFGFSQRLPMLPDWVAERYRQHIATYTSCVRRFVQQATLLRLTESPRRFGEGQRWAAFQYSMPKAHEHLLAVFRLPGAAPAYSVQLQHLDPERVYRLSWLDETQSLDMQGSTLMQQGLSFELAEEGSALVLMNGI